MRKIYYRLNHCVMIAVVLFVMLIITAFSGIAQQLPSANTEQQLETATENNGDNEMQDDSFLQLLQQYLRSPLNLNTADADALNELGLLLPVQVHNIISYRAMLGKFISIYELQAVPSLDVATIEKIKPYVTVSSDAGLVHSFAQRLKGGTHTVVARVSQVLERSKGYVRAPLSTANYYTGSPQRLFVRYKYQYKNLLQYGITGDKDAGESFFKGGQKAGFDFYSVHVFMRNAGIIKALAIGDFTVNMGQGLIQWQSLAFKKSGDVLNIKRQLPVLRPYSSAGEANFHRGIGITLAKKKLECTGFISYRHIDANLATDTVANEDFVTSFQSSGLHRTQSELADKGIQRQLAYGGNILYNNKKWHFGANIIRYTFKLPVVKASEPYNIYALSGKQWGNASMDYSYTHRNFHFFGEVAIDSKMSTAFINGLLVSVSAFADMSFVYRNISPRYQALYSNAFTENTAPVNEKGLYTAISIHPNSSWRLDAYADFYRFPWLRYQVDAPSVGVDYLAQLTYKPNKQVEVYCRYRTESKPANDHSSGFGTSHLLLRQRQSLRLQLNARVNASFTIRNRAEIVWYNRKRNDAQAGFLSYADIIYKPMMKRYGGSIRFMYFETGGYESRVYAYENDVLYSFSIPAVYGKGLRYYFNFNYDFNKKLTCWLRVARTIYADKATIGSGLDEISGNGKTEVKLQLQYSF